MSRNVADGTVLELVRELRRTVAETVADPSPLDASRLDMRDASLVEALLPVFERLNRSWLRLRVDGGENIPRTPALFAGNHSGGITGPDLPCTLGTLWRTLGPASPLYMMAHDLAMRHITPLGRILQRVGCIRADPENAHSVLSSGGHVLVYPGGELDAFRPFRERNRVIFGERTGFVRAAQRAGVPIVPVVAFGAHSSSIILDNGAWLATLLGLPKHRVYRMPIAIGLPWGIAAGPLPYLPLPLPVRLRFLPPIEAPRDTDPATIRDEVVSQMQSAMDAMSQER